MKYLSLILLTGCFSDRHNLIIQNKDGYYFCSNIYTGASDKKVSFTNCVKSGKDETSNYEVNFYNIDDTKITIVINDKK